MIGVEVVEELAGCDAGGEAIQAAEITVTTTRAGKCRMFVWTARSSFPESNRRSQRRQRSDGLIADHKAWARAHPLRECGCCRSVSANRIG
jgi:hypothetical protein